MEKNNNNSTTGDNNSLRVSGVQNFRTLQGDMVNAVKKQDRSLAQIIIADKKRKRGSGYRDQKILIEEKRPNSFFKIFLVVCITLVVIITAVFSTGSVWKNDRSKNTAEQILETLIPIDKQIVINTKIFTDSDNDLITIINDSLSKNETSTGDIVHLCFVKTTKIADEKTNKTKEENSVLPVDEFFGSWNNDAPETLIRIFKKESYLFGVHYNKTETVPFLLFELKDLDQAFAGMLVWEKNLCSDTQNIFGIKEKCPNSSFKNELLFNMDVRTLVSESKKPAILYGFLNNNNVLIITKSTTTLEKINSLFD